MDKENLRGLAKAAMLLTIQIAGGEELSAKEMEDARKYLKLLDEEYAKIQEYGLRDPDAETYLEKKQLVNELEVEYAVEQERKRLAGKKVADVVESIEMLEDNYGHISTELNSIARFAGKQLGEKCGDCDGDLQFVANAIWDVHCKKRSPYWVEDEKTLSGKEKNSLKIKSFLCILISVLLFMPFVTDRISALFTNYDVGTIIGAIIVIIGLFTGGIVGAGIALVLVVGVMVGFEKLPQAIQSLGTHYGVSAVVTIFLIKSLFGKLGELKEDKEARKKYAGAKYKERSEGYDEWKKDRKEKIDAYINRYIKIKADYKERMEKQKGARIVESSSSSADLTKEDQMYQVFATILDNAIEKYRSIQRGL